MIKITVELVSAIDPARSRVLGTAIIANNGQKSVATRGMKGDYTVQLNKQPPLKGVWRKAHITDFPRKRLGAWDLLYRALKACVEDRNP